LVTERDKELLGAEIVGYCMNKARTMGEITKKIYNYEDLTSKRLASYGRIYQMIEVLVNHGVLSVKCNDRQIRFQVNGGYFEKK